MERREPRKFLNSRYWSCRVLFHVLVVLGLSAVLYKAFRLQVLEHSLWVERAHAQLSTTFNVPAYRGSIYDRQNRLLSYSVPQRSLYADGDHVDNPKKIAAQLALILGESADAVEKKLAATRHFAWVKRYLTDQQAQAVENIKGPGLNLTNEYKRFYPYRQVGGQVVGFVDMDGTGLEGIEKSFDDVLRGNSTSVGQLRDGVRKCIWMKSSAPPEPAESYGVRLSLDAFIQYLSECELEKAVQKYHARAGEVVVLDARTSEVLAMVNWPFFDPNLPDKKDAQLWRNRTVGDSFEPGSAFKVFLMSGALEEGLVHINDRIYCEGGHANIAGHSIKDVHPFGWLTMPEVIKVSSNIGAAKIALHVGGERYYRYIQGFGFGSMTDIQLPGEVKGLVRHFHRWRPIDLATTGFGQSIGVTSLQLTSAVEAIANGGEYSSPIIATDLLDSRGNQVQEFHSCKVRRVIQKKTADQIRAMMCLVTQEGGTGVSAVPDGYTVAGKTGTAQVMDPVTKHYASHKYTAVFTGFIPSEQPRLIISVVIHEPQGSIYGGVVSAPVFRNIAEKALPYLGVMPSIPSLAPVPAIRLINTSPAGSAKEPTGTKNSGVSKSSGNSAQKSTANKSASRKTNSGAALVKAGKGQVKPQANRPKQLDTYTFKVDGRENGLN